MGHVSLILIRNCVGNVKEIAPSSYRSYVNDFDWELRGKLFYLAVIGHVSMILIRNCKGNRKEIAPSSYRSYVNDFDKEL